MFSTVPLFSTTPAILCRWMLASTVHVFAGSSTRLILRVALPELNRPDFNEPAAAAAVTVMETALDELDAYVLSPS